LENRKRRRKGRIDFDMSRAVMVRTECKIYKGCRK